MLAPYPTLLSSEHCPSPITCPPPTRTELPGGRTCLVFRAPKAEPRNTDQKKQNAASLTDEETEPLRLRKPSASSSREPALPHSAFSSHPNPSQQELRRTLTDDHSYRAAPSCALGARRPSHLKELGGGGLHRVHRVALLRSGAASCTSPASLSPSSQAL